jgi:hypothetical protein
MAFIVSVAAIFMMFWPLLMIAGNIPALIH